MMMKKTPDVSTVLTLLRTKYDTSIALVYHTPFELAIAVILSAQCTDKRVNEVTKLFFPKLGTDQVKTLATMPQKTIEESIHSTGFYKAKAANIKKLAQTLLEKYDGKLPDSMEELITLPGIGRKSANVLLGAIFNKSEGIVVDTHVKRIAARLQYTTATDPEKVEKDLMKLIPKTEWNDFPHLIIKLGRDTCIARRPKCSDCILRAICPTAPLYL